MILINKHSKIYQVTPTLIARYIVTDFTRLKSCALILVQNKYK